jgi:hypothetical protein
MPRLEEEFEHTRVVPQDQPLGDLFVARQTDFVGNASLGELFCGFLTMRRLVSRDEKKTATSLLSSPMQMSYRIVQQGVCQRYRGMRVAFRCLTLYDVTILSPLKVMS